LRNKIIKSLRITIGVVSAVCVLWGALFVYMRTSEGCFVGASDQRLIDKAIRYEISAGQRDIDLRLDPGLIKYQSIEEFKEKNKNCCKVERTHFEVTYALDRAIGQTEVAVTFWYRAASLGAEPFYLSYVIMNACGKPLTSRGITMAEGPND
jgi:hypothetical protein